VIGRITQIFEDDAKITISFSRVTYSSEVGWFFKEAPADKI
jgi:hypothetical protein